MLVKTTKYSFAICETDNSIKNAKKGRQLSLTLIISVETLIFAAYLTNFKTTPLLAMVQEEKKRYSEEDLKEFQELISQKLDATRNELNYIKETLSKRNDSGTDNTSGNSKLLEDGADTSERENLSQLAARLQKFIQQLDAAMVRIKNGTYGICKDTGKLIPKERLRAVPHTQQTIEAKLRQSN